MPLRGLRNRPADEWRNEGLEFRQILERDLRRFRSPDVVKFPQHAGGQTTAQDPGLSTDLTRLMVENDADLSHLDHIIPEIDAGRESSEEKAALEGRASTCVQLLNNFRIPLTMCPFPAVSKEVAIEYERHCDQSKRYIYNIKPRIDTSDHEPVETFLPVFREVVRRVGPPIALGINFKPFSSMPWELLEQVYNDDEVNAAGVVTAKIEIDTLYVLSPWEHSNWKKRPDGYLNVRPEVGGNEGKPQVEWTDLSDAEICNRIIYGCDDNGALTSRVEVAHMKETEHGLTLTGAPNAAFHEPERIYKEMAEFFHKLPKLKNVRLLYDVRDSRLQYLAPNPVPTKTRVQGTPVSHTG